MSTEQVPMSTDSISSFGALKSQFNLQLGALRDHVQQLERENEELQHKYQDALDHSHTLELEKKEMQKEMDSMRDEILDIRERGEDLKDVVADLKMKETVLFRPAVYDLERTHHKTTHLQSQLTQQQQHTKQLSTRLSHSMEENQRYRDALEHNDVALRRKEESSKHALNALNQQIEALQSENEELKKELVHYESYTVRKHPNQHNQHRHDVEEEKVSRAYDLDSMNGGVNEMQFQNTFKRIIDDRLSDSGDSNISLSDLETVDKESIDISLVDGLTNVIRRRKRSLSNSNMSGPDLAAIIRRDSAGGYSRTPSYSMDHDRMWSYAYMDGGEGQNETKTVSDMVTMEKYKDLQEKYDKVLNKLERRERRIDTLCDTIATLKIKKAQKRGYGWLPWCG